LCICRNTAVKIKQLKIKKWNKPIKY